MNAQLVQWRCRSCGLARPMGESECQCGTARLSSADKLKLLTSAVSNEGCGNVQNNTNNLAVHGDFHFGNYFSQSVEEDEEEEERRRARNYRSPLASFLLFTSGIAMWLAILIMFGTVFFFVAIIYKAFFMH